MTCPHMGTIPISVLNLVTASISPSVLAVRELHALSLRIFFFGPTFDLEKFSTSGVKGRVLLEATHPIDHLLLQLRSSTLESHKATTRTALLNR